MKEGRKEGSVYLTTHTTHLIKPTELHKHVEGFKNTSFVVHVIMHEGRKEGRKEVFYLTTHTTHLIKPTELQKHVEGFKNTYVVFHVIMHEGRKEVFYLTAHSTHFIYGYNGRKEGNVLLNGALNTFYLLL